MSWIFLAVINGWKRVPNKARLWLFVALMLALALFSAYIKGRWDRSKEIDVNIEQARQSLEQQRTGIDKDVEDMSDRDKCSWFGWVSDTDC